MAQPEQIKLGVVGDDLVLLQAFTQFTQVVANGLQIKQPRRMFRNRQAEKADIAAPRVQSVSVSLDVQGHSVSRLPYDGCNLAQQRRISQNPILRRGNIGNLFHSMYIKLFYYPPCCSCCVCFRGWHS